MMNNIYDIPNFRLIKLQRIQQNFFIFPFNFLIVRTQYCFVLHNFWSHFVVNASNLVERWSLFNWFKKRICNEYSWGLEGGSWVVFHTSGGINQGVSDFVSRTQVSFFEDRLKWGQLKYSIVTSAPVVRIIDLFIKWFFSHNYRKFWEILKKKYLFYLYISCNIL